jgi:2,2-dialkylglycine decarboxylase (pyruvate)
MNQTKSLELWRRHGRDVLVVQPFMDSLITGGEGCYLRDVDGNRILDLAAGQFCSILGHAHKKFGERLKAQTERLIHLGDQFLSPNVLEAAGRLAGVAPGPLNRVLFLSTGSEANECAMRIAKKVTGRSGMLAFTRGYYGVSLATRTLSSISDHPGAVDFQPAPAGQFKLLTPVPHRCPVGRDHPSCTLHCLDASFEMLGDQFDNVAAVIIEPVISAGGMVFPPREYLQALQSRAKNAGALFIVDEAQTGFGRCGRWFDIQNLALEPDILVVSKTAGNGYPAAALVVSDEIAARLEKTGFSHLSSHQNDPLAAAAVHAVIDIVEEEGLVQRSEDTGAYFVARLRELQARHPLIREVRGRGLMIGLELSGTEHEGRPLAFELAMLCERRGVHVTFTYYEPVIRFIPPLIISNAEIDQAIAVLDEALTAMRAGAQPIGDLIPRNERSGPYVQQMISGISPLKLLRKMWRTSPQQWARKLKALM